jgi:2-methylcitrate dehydratase
MTLAEDLAAFVVDATWERIAEASREQLKLRVLDTLACAIGALDAPLMVTLRDHCAEFAAGGRCTLIGGGRTSPHAAAFNNGALVRYLDFNDSYMAARDYSHPSDNLSAVLAAAEYAGLDGKGFLTALAVAYQVQLRLADVAPVLAKGFDHTVHGAYSVACGVAKALGLDAAATMNAIGMAGTSFNSLRVTRTGTLSNWKGLAFANTAFGATHAALLAMRGVTGPSEVFEGNKGFMHTIAGQFSIDWTAEGLDAVLKTSIKRYNATIDSQSSIDAMLQLRDRHRFAPEDVAGIDVEIFQLAYDVIGGGEEGDKYTVVTKEQADHSLRYVVACACLDGQMMPEQYTPERIGRPDVQTLLKRVRIRPAADLTARFPAECPVRIQVTLRDGSTHSIEQAMYDGYFNQPMSWRSVAAKFDRLVTPRYSPARRAALVDVVMTLDDGDAMAHLIEVVGSP